MQLVNWSRAKRQAGIWSPGPFLFLHAILTNALNSHYDWVHQINPNCSHMLQVRLGEVYEAAFREESGMFYEFLQQESLNVFSF